VSESVGVTRQANHAEKIGGNVLKPKKVGCDKSVRKARWDGALYGGREPISQCERP
jgi:hypothetical protein